MSIQILAQELEPGCMVKVFCPIDNRETLATVQAVRSTDTGIEADICTRRPLPCPDVPWRSNYWTLTATWNSPVSVSHLPSKTQ